MHKVFLGGPIQHLGNDPFALQKMKELVGQFRNRLSQDGLVVLSAHVVEAFGELTPDWEATAIASRDFDWMLACDVFVAFLPSSSIGRPLRTDGTHIELGWATALGKPTFVVIDEDAVQAISDLLKGLIQSNKIRMFSMSLALERPDALATEILALLASAQEGSDSRV